MVFLNLVVCLNLRSRMAEAALDGTIRKVELMAFIGGTIMIIL